MYATEADIDRLYPGQLDRLAWDMEAEARDTARIAAALSDATAFVNSYIAARYPLPLSTVPDVLVTLCVDIALWRLASTADLLTEEISYRHKHAHDWLKDVAAGRAALDVPAGTPEATAPDLPELDAPERLFRRERGL
ncbi:DUF1320 domain-containing protein [Kaustia mangrovi]|uniref:DUF1320 domain-containing protein n=1 Tax=Kaustia mangrovi TaxID=2593653 RepID=A0A7S8C6W8_9HYPH|nr:DUF1320 domain-containing protein [Kaustia mangrovi]QPC44515.1 DUF1320 domain-containing protein [Kaustia mangrovi]